MLAAVTGLAAALTPTLHISLVRWPSKAVDYGVKPRLASFRQISRNVKSADKTQIGVSHRKRRPWKAIVLCFSATLGLTSQGDDRFRTENVTFTAACDGTTQRYVCMLPKSFRPEMRHHVLVALHGHGSDRWQFASGTTPTGVAVRNAAAERGMILILPDYRAKTSWMGPKAETDMCQIIEIEVTP